jgi:hypothetical protein
MVVSVYKIIYTLHDLPLSGANFFSGTFTLLMQTNTDIIGSVKYEVTFSVSCYGGRTA